MDSSERVVAFGHSGSEVREKLARLRALLDEKGFSENREAAGGMFWSSGLAEIDARGGGGFPSAAISEVVVEGPSAGAGLLVYALLKSAWQARRIVGLVDGRDRFDPESVAAGLLPCLFWVRCAKAAQAMQAVDLLARDGNLPLLLLDLRENTAGELRHQPPGVWHRLQRVVEKTGVTLVAVTSIPCVASARLRFLLRGPLSLEVHDQARETLLSGLTVESIICRQAGKTA